MPALAAGLSFIFVPDSSSFWNTTLGAYCQFMSSAMTCKTRKCIGIGVPSGCSHDQLATQPLGPSVGGTSTVLFSQYHVLNFLH